MCVCVWGGVWIYLLYAHCNMGLIDLTDSLIIITKCRCGELKTQIVVTSCHLMGNFMFKEAVALLWFFFFFPQFCCIQVTFSHIHRCPSSCSASLLEVIVTENLRTFTFNNLQNVHLEIHPGGIPPTFVGHNNELMVRIVLNLCCLHRSTSVSLLPLWCNTG